MYYDVTWAQKGLRKKSLRIRLLVSVLVCIVLFSGITSASKQATKTQNTPASLNFELLAFYVSRLNGVNCLSLEQIAEVVHGEWDWDSAGNILTLRLLSLDRVPERGKERGFFQAYRMSVGRGLRFLVESSEREVAEYPGVIPQFRIHSGKLYLSVRILEKISDVRVCWEPKGSYIHFINPRTSKLRTEYQNYISVLPSLQSPSDFAVGNWYANDKVYLSKYRTFLEFSHYIYIRRSANGRYGAKMELYLSDSRFPDAEMRSMFEYETVSWEKGGQELVFYKSFATATHDSGSEFKMPEVFRLKKAGDQFQLDYGAPAEGEWRYVTFRRF